MYIAQGQDTFKDIRYVVLANTAPFNGRAQVIQRSNIYGSVGIG